MRTLLVTDGDGDFKVEIPDEATVTFGPTIPYQPKNGYAGSNHYSLRVYQGSDKGKLLAVFAGVQHFRDSSLPVLRKILKEEGKTLWKSDEEGYKVEHEVRRASNWEDEFACDAKLLPPVAPATFVKRTPRRRRGR